MPASLAVARTEPEDVDRHEVVATLLAAFRDDPAVRSLYPTDLEYVRHFPGFLHAFGKLAFDLGDIDQDAEGHAAALWFPPGIAPDSDAIMNHLKLSIPGKRLGPVAAGIEMQGSLHPTERHWYLPWMGVVPEAQGMGIGATLLRKGLVRADDDRLPVYLEATSRRSAAFYARHGFEAKAIVSVPNYPEIITMWRPAR